MIEGNQRSNCVWMGVVIASEAKQSRERRTPDDLWIVASLRSSQ